MIFVGLFLLCITTIGAVFVPWISPILFALMYKSVYLWINPIFVVLICTAIATTTTSTIWFLNKKIHKYFEKKIQNNPNKNWITRKVRRRFDLRFGFMKNKYILFFAILVWSGSIIPDLFLVEFGRTKMNFFLFIFAIAIWKFITYTITMFGIEKIFYFFK